MQFKQNTRSLIVVIVGAVLYYFSAMVAIGIAMSYPMPEWWSVDSSSSLRAWSWLHSIHALGVLVASVPFALGIRWLQLKDPVMVGLGICILGLFVPIIIPDIERLLAAPTHSQVSAALDTLKFVGTLPLITWLVTRNMPSNPGSVTSAAAERQHCASW
jgi:hypothetical protein